MCEYLWLAKFVQASRNYYPGLSFVFSADFYLVPTSFKHLNIFRNENYFDFDFLRLAIAYCIQFVMLKERKDSSLSNNNILFK